MKWLTEQNKIVLWKKQPFTTGATAVFFNPVYNDHGIITSLIPFNMMNTFLRVSFEKMASVLSERGIDDYHFKVAFFAKEKSEDHFKKSSEICATRREHTMYTSDLAGVRVRFQFYCSYYPAWVAHTDEQVRKARIYKESFTVLSNVLAEAYDEAKSEVLI